MLGLDHEMDLSYAKHGTAAEYRAAYKHLRAVFAAQGVDNVVWTWVTSGYVAYGNGPHVKSFYPGDAYVDWIGYDPYNFNTCHKSGWETFDQTVKGFYDWSAANGLGSKPLLVQEYGMHYGDNAKSRQWYRDIDDVLRKRTRIKALVRWDSDTSCTLRIDNGTGMVAEFKAAGLAVDRP
ncbi:glycosyl hydrolase [Kineosporia sp. R_H_3]|uniref:glycosyl hydrolase n=1 Tax=Kineosporia sp. R_H_3 TaxID=1961848 RepID=UPI00350EA798